MSEKYWRRAQSNPILGLKTQLYIKMEEPVDQTFAPLVSYQLITVQRINISP